MPLALCPECGREVSTAAEACPNCGLPITVPPPVDRKVVISRPHRENEFPPWAVAAIVVGAVFLLGIAYLVLRDGDDANTNVNVNIASRRTAATDTSRDDSATTTTTVPPSAPSSVTVPPSSTTTTVPSTSAPSAVAPASDRGKVTIKARLLPSRGDARAAGGTRFYLLDKDVESILSEADVEPVEGNTLSGSLGLAVVFPDRYGEFQRAAMRAIARHVKHSGTTSSDGSLDINGVEPDSYYLFAISRVGRGFALWNQVVSVTGGDNILNLSPQPITELIDPRG